MTGYGRKYGGWWDDKNMNEFGALYIGEYTT